MKKIFLGITLIFLLTMLLSGCTKDKKSEPMKIGVISDMGAVPFVIAEQQGFYEKRGLQIEIQVFKSALDRDTALQAGQLDGAMSDMLSVIFFNDAAFEVKMTSQTYGNYLLVTAPQMSKEAFLNLEAVKIGLSSNTVIDFATQKVAELKGFEGKLSKIAIPQMPVRLEMLRSGELDGATLPEPLASVAILEGGSVIGSTEDFNLYPGVFLMTQAALDDSSADIRLMYEAYNEAVELLNQQDMMTYFDYLAERLSFPSNLKEHLKMPVFSKAMAPDALTFTEISSWMNKTGLSQQLYSLDALTDSRVLPE